MVAAGGIRVSIAAKSASRSSSNSAPPWHKFIDSPQWIKAVSQNPGLSPFFANLESFVELPEGVEKLREMVLKLAISGMLASQSDEDEHARVLVEAIATERDEELREVLTDDVPANWCVCRLGQLANIVYGKGLPTKNLLDAGYPVFGANGIIGKFDRYLYESEQLLISCRGAYSGKINMSPPECFVTNNSLVLELTETGVKLRPYLFHALAALDRSEMVTGSAQPQVTIKNAVGFQIPVPPLAEQRRIVSKVEGLMSLCDTLESQRRARMGVRERASRSVLASLTSAPVQPRALAHQEPDSDRRCERQGASRRSSTVDVDPPKPTASALSLTRNTTESNGPPTGETLASAWQRLSDHFEVLLDQPAGPRHLRQSILQLAVQGKLVPQDPSDEPASELLAEIAARKKELVDAKEIAKPKKLPALETDTLPFDLPDGWEWIRLESVCEVITKGSSPKWQGVSYLDTSDGGIMFVTSENVGNYVMRKMDRPKYVEAKFNEMEPRSILQRKDILVNLVGASIGRSAMWDRDDVANINQAVGIVRLVPDCRTVNRRYLLGYLNSPTCLEIMLGNRVTTAQPNISLTNVKHFPVPIPPKAEQKRIVSKVSVLLSQLDELSARLRSRQSTTDALLTALVHQILEGADA